MMERRSSKSPILAICGFLLVWVACDDSDDGDISSFDQLDISVCDPAAGSFSTNVDNPYFPLPVGRTAIFEGEDVEEGVVIRVEARVLDDTEEIAGVDTRVVEVRELEDGELFEVSHDFYAQAPDGTVCYFGEDVDVIEDGDVVSNEGEWRAGDGDNRPGIIMPGDIDDGVMFQQEVAPGIAEDMSAIVDDGRRASVQVGSFEEVLLVVDWNPLEGETSDEGEEKLYAPGVGLIVDDVVELVELSEP